MINEICSVIEKIRNQKPLIHHLTNYVTANDSANITLAIGASPVMASEILEVEEMAAHASALVINIGTLNAPTVEAMIVAGKKAQSLGIPIIFDPVGVGATSYRTAVAERIIREVKPTIIRGNMSEIKLLSGISAAIKGVDSVADETNGENIAIKLSQKLNCVIAVTGKTDIIVDGNKVCRIDNGDIMLTNVTGTGCMSSSLVGSCAAVANPFVGAVTGIAMMGIAGELASSGLKPDEGIGSFRIRLFDAIYNLSGEILRDKIRLS
ncbi:hydroxyethylthiazole kinase [Dendrosporobacter sp. 1207_IL3150]|uniref:hydroxyethylthiazole kinase n=1 Tax=Dendrosporobacter sp. 1207_IL3150 TaxID=3084054 RepID=UPI002FDAE7C0